MESPAATAELQLDLVQRQFAAEIRDIDRALSAYLDGFDAPAAHYGMLRYHFGYADASLADLPGNAFLPRGKRLRPLICLLLSRSFGLGAGVTRSLMLATEIMHGASLVHDDIEDRDALRWNRPTLQAAFGLEQAINAGDTLIGMVYQVLLGLGGQGVAPAVLIEVMEVFNRAHLQMCEGQHLDLRHRCSDGLSIGDYLAMVERKTGAPCVCIGDAIGALAGAGPGTRETLRLFGRSLGILHQIGDDVRGIWSVPAELGRSIGHDVIQQRPSLPLLYACQHGPAGLRQALLDEAGRAKPLSDEELRFIQQGMADCGAGRYCRDQALRHHATALECLAALQREGPEMALLRGTLDACLASVDFLE